VEIEKEKALQTSKEIGWRSAKIFSISIIAVILYLFIYFTIPQVYDSLYGEETRQEVLQDIKASGTDEFALELMDWENREFTSPYFKQEENWHRRYMIYKNKNDDLTIFGAGGPASWAIYSGLANCYGYANVFAILMEDRGTEARLVEGRGDDHVWAKYKRNGTWIAVDPSANKTIIPTNLGEKKDLSYVVSVDPETGEVVNQLTSKYVDTSNLSVKVTDNGRPIENVEVELKDPELMRETDRYTRPRKMVEKDTGVEGETSFRIGNGEYIMKITKPVFLFDQSHKRNITIRKNREIEINFSEIYYKWKIF
jgi:hypothetical protein